LPGISKASHGAEAPTCRPHVEAPQRGCSALRTLAKNVIAPAEEKVKAMENRRRVIEAELTKPQ
jgi:hypothetical protein